MSRDPRAESVVDEILKRRPDLSREEVWNMIYDKIREVGEGLLTEVGASYLVASELGVDLDVLPAPILRLNELKPGLRKVDVKAFFLCKGEERSFSSRKGQGTLSEYFLYDAGITARLLVWGNPEFKDVLDALRPGDPIKLSSVDIREGRNGGGIEVHFTNKSNVDILNEKSSASLLETITYDVSELEPDMEGGTIAIKGRIISEFSERRYFLKNEEKKMVYFTLASTKENVERKTIRIVIWGAGKDHVSGITVGSVVRIVCGKLKRSRSGKLEFHATNNSPIEVLELAELEKKSGDFLLISRGQELPNRRVEAIFVDSSGSTLVVVASGEAAGKLELLEPGSLVSIRSGRKIGYRIVIDDPNQISELGRDQSRLLQFKTAIGGLPSYKGDVCIVEGIVLSKPSEKDVATKGGEVVKKASVLIGDHTGEVLLTGWRENAGLVTDLKLGDKIVAYGVYIRRRERQPELEVKPYTLIHKKEEQKI